MMEDPASNEPSGMVFIPAGPFLIGSAEFDIEGPPRHVDLHAYFIDRTPVTNAQYRVFVSATDHRPPPDWDSGQPSADRLNHPVDRVSWDDAASYARWVGKRLPTETEWEKAARGTDGRRWPWGNEFDETRCIVWDHALALGVTTCPVDGYPSGASPYGVMQMAGNVEEWVSDEFHPYPGSTHDSPSVRAGLRVLRGGSWFYTMEYARCAFRRAAFPEFTGYPGCGGPGFRCALDTPRLP
jgi:formylglycine-generating enzyme required for sulfatase activity